MSLVLHKQPYLVTGLTGVVKKDELPCAVTASLFRGEPSHEVMLKRLESLEAIRERHILASYIKLKHRLLKHAAEQCLTDDDEFFEIS